MTWRRWDDVLGPAAVTRTLDDHAAATGAPRRLAGTFIASAIVSALARLQGTNLTLRGRAVPMAPAQLHLRVVDGVVRSELAPERLDDDLAEAEMRASAAVDRLADHCVAAISRDGRVSRRLLACDASLAWLAGIRAAQTELPTHDEPADLLARQWHCRHDLDGLVRRHVVSRGNGGTKPYLVRSVCCLEYRIGPAEHQTFCATCPLIPLDAVLHRRERIERGDRPPPFSRDDRRGRPGAGPLEGQATTTNRS